MGYRFHYLMKPWLNYTKKQLQLKRCILMQVGLLCPVYLQLKTKIGTTLERLLDVPLLINFFIFFHLLHPYPNLHTIRNPPSLLMIGESFQLRKTFWNKILMLNFLQSCKKFCHAVLCFVFVSFFEEANRLCFVL